MIEIKVLDRNNWMPYSGGLQELESLAEYPYGLDSFRIDHGPSYFQFFERLGKPVFHVAIQDSRIVACAAGILRKLPAGGARSAPPVKAWYLCDLKVHPDFRGQRITTRLFQKNLLRNYLRCGRGYAFSMNPPGERNRVVELLQRMSWLPFAVMGQLNFYSLDWHQMTDNAGAIQQLVGPVSFLSLAGKKDIILKSTQAPMSLLHLQHGPFAEPQLREPQLGAQHMLCAVANSPLDRLLTSRFSVSAQAAIVAHRLANMTWDFVLSSEI